MAGRFSLWNPRKNKDYQYIDRTIAEMFNMAATSVMVHKYLGVNGGTDPTQVQDPLLLENRTRHYDPDVYELLATYNVQDSEYDLSQFGQIVSSDILYMEMHLNDSVRRLGRKILAGDVFEVPAFRDDALLDESTPAINRYYVVKEVTKDANGYSPTWFPHLIRVKLQLLTDAQEFEEILNSPILDGNGDPIIPDDGNGPTSLADIISDYNTKIEINNAVVKEAEEAVDRRNFQTQQFYVVPGDELGKQYPWIFAGDGTPPNGASLIGSGNRFPTDAVDGDYYLRTDMEPYVLYRKDGVKWRRQEVDYRKKWIAAHRILAGFINNKNITTIQGDSFAEKQPISKAVTIKADF
jgi:hypothetical protein